MARPTKTPGNVGTYIYNDKKDKMKFNSSYWWLSPQGDCHNQVFENAKEYFRKWGANYYELVGHKNRYEERDIAVGINISPWSKIRGSKYLSANVTASVIDTLVSKIAKNVPSIQYVTSGGDWNEQQQAKDLEKYVLGTFLNKNVHANLRTMFGDCCKVGTGFIVMDDYNGQLEYHNYPAYAVMCDWLDAQSGEPVDIHFVSIESRFKLMMRYPEHKEKLALTDSSIQFYSENNLNSKDCVVMIRSYNTFSKRRAVTVENCTLKDDDTLLDTIVTADGLPMSPFVYQIYKESSFGMFSIGIAEELRPLHDVIDKTIRVIQRSAHLGAVPKTFVSRQANIVESILDNDIGSIIMYDGGPDMVPVSAPMLKIPTDLHVLVQYYYDLAFKKAGLSQLTAASQKPAGLNSGKALSTYFDIEADRFQSTAKLYERAVIDLNYLTIKYSRYLENMGYKQKAKFYGQKIQKEIDFRTVDLDEESFDIQAYPVSIIPQTPAGRYETIRDMLQLGLLDQQRTLKLLDLPDVEGDTNIQNAQLDYARYQIYCLMNNIGTPYPEQNQDLNLLIREAQNHYYFYKQKNPEPDALKRLQDFIEQAKMLASSQQQDAQLIAQQMMQQQMMQQAQSGAPMTPGASFPMAS